MPAILLHDTRQSRCSSYKNLAQNFYLNKTQPYSPNSFTRNPVPGKLFNDYNHTDVYAGVKVDYRGGVSIIFYLRIFYPDNKIHS